MQRDLAASWVAGRARKTFSVNCRRSRELPYTSLAEAELSMPSVPKHSEVQRDRPTLSKAHSNVACLALQATDEAGSAGVSMEYLIQDVEIASFPDDAFDRILCSNGMAYLQQPQAMLQRFRSWLSPGGKLVFNSPLVGPVLAHWSTSCMRWTCEVACMPHTLKL